MKLRTTDCHSYGYLLGSGDPHAYGAGVARNPNRDGKAFEETQAPFTGRAPDLAATFAAYDFHCAFTGDDLHAEAAVDPLGALLLLTGRPARSAMVPACLDAIYAYEHGHLALGPRYNFLVDLERIDPEFLERLNPIGRLALPEDAALHPPQALLKAHREAVAEGLID